jgi:hypothetical protein
MDKIQRAGDADRTRFVALAPGGVNDAQKLFRAYFDPCMAVGEQRRCEPAHSRAADG